MASAGTAPSASVSGTGGGHSYSPAYSYYVVACLMLASSFSFLDRLVLGLMVDPIREDLGLTDVHIALLSSTAFAIWYVVFAFVFGWWVDRRGRRNAIVLGMVLWSAATAACGFANSFIKLFFARAAVGIGEGSLNPAAYSLVADYFPPARRGLAMSIFACGATVGGGMAIMAGAQVIEWVMATRPQLPLMAGAAPWQTVFVLVGLPGVLVALLIWLTVREPKRRITAADTSDAPKLGEVLGYIGDNWKVFLPIFAGYAGIAVNGYAFTVWGPAYLMRLHDLTPGDVGLLFGIGYGIFGTIGVILGGLISDALVKRGYIDAPIRVTIAVVIIQAPLFIASYLVADAFLASALFCTAMVLACFMAGLQAAMVQSLAPNRMRGMLAALYGAVVNLAGLGLAPPLTAYLSEEVFGGPMGIGKALAVTSALSLGLALVLIVSALGRARALATSLAEPVTA